MNPEQGVVVAGIQFAVECQIVLVGEFGGFLCPLRLCAVDNKVAVGVLPFAVFPFALLAADNRHGQEAAIFAQEGVDTFLFEEFGAVAVDMQHNVGAAFGAGAFTEGVFGRAVAFPAHRSGTFAVAQRVDFHLVGNHECRVEAQAEVADDGVRAVFVFIEEVLGTRKGNLVDVFFDIVGVHADAAVAHCQCACGFVEGHSHRGIAYLALEFAERRQGAQFLCGVHGIAHQFAEEDFVVAVEELLYYRKDVLGCNTYFSCCLHMLFVWFLVVITIQQSKCQRQGLSFWHF